MRKKTKNKKILPQVPQPSTRGRDSSPSARMRHSGKRLASPSARVRHSGIRLFPECISSPSATLEEEFLPRVPDIWQSGKPEALGEFPFSRSEHTVTLKRPNHSPRKGMRPAKWAANGDRECCRFSIKFAWAIHRRRLGVNSLLIWGWFVSVKETDMTHVHCKFWNVLHGHLSSNQLKV
jgi:hypothetical protein